MSVISKRVVPSSHSFTQSLTHERRPNFGFTPVTSRAKSSDIVVTSSIRKFQEVGLRLQLAQRAPRLIVAILAYRANLYLLLFCDSIGQLFQTVIVKRVLVAAFHGFLLQKVACVTCPPGNR